VLLDFFSTFIVVGFDGLDEFVECASITGFNICDGQARCGLPAYNTSKPGLVLDDAIGNSHLSAKGWQKEDELNRIDIIGNHNKLCLLFFNQGCDGVGTMMDNSLLFGRLILATSSTSLGSCLQTLLPLLLGLRTITVHELEQLSGGLLF